MFLFLAAFVFWLALNGRLGTYAAFMTTTGNDSWSNLLPSWLGGGTAAPPTPPGQSAPLPGKQNTPGGGAGVFGPQRSGGGYTPNPNDPGILIPDTSPSPAFGGFSMNDLTGQAAANSAGGAAGL